MMEAKIIHLSGAAAEPVKQSHLLGRHPMSDMTVTEAPSSEELSTSMHRLLGELSTQRANQCEFLMMLENADLGPTAEALAFAMFATIKEGSDTHTALSDVAQLLIERVRILKVSHG